MSEMKITNNHNGMALTSSNSNKNELLKMMGSDNDIIIQDSTDYQGFLTLTNSTNKNNIISSLNSGNVVSSDFEFQVTKAVDRVMELIFSEDYIEGEASKTQLYFEYLYCKNKNIFLEVFNRAWVSLYREENYYIMMFLNVASTIPYEWLKYRADSVVMGFNSIEDPLVNEAAIRAAESWGQKSHVEILEKMRDFEISWIQQYKLDVIRYLRSL